MGKYSSSGTYHHDTGLGLRAVLRRVAILILAGLSPLAVGDQEHKNVDLPDATLCEEGEIIYFSCELTTKLIASLCGMPQSAGDSESAEGAKLRYRLGTKTTKTLIYPADTDVGRSPFFGEHLNPYGENIVLDSVIFLLDGKLRGISVREGPKSFIGVWAAGPTYEETECIRKPGTGRFLNLILDLPPKQ